MKEAKKPRPTWEQFMLEHGMNEPDKIREDIREKWRVRYNLEHPPEKDGKPPVSEFAL